MAPRLWPSRNVHPNLPPPYFENKTSNIDITVTTKTLSRPSSLSQRLGRWTIATLIGGTAVILAACGFLIYLWTADERNPFWKKIMTSEWAIGTVTITTLVTSTTVAAQAVICTAMLASLALEKGQASISQAAGVSEMRSLTAGPFDLAFHLWRGRRHYGAVLTMSTLLLVLLILSQFISTILLSDFVNRPVLGYPKTENVSYGILYDDTNISNGGFSNDYFKSRPPFYASFAEHREPAIARGGFHSTGTTLRGFLPFPELTTRSALSDYTGRLSVLDTTVVCVRPEATFNVQVGHYGYLLKGTMQPRDIRNETVGVQRPLEPLRFTAYGAVPDYLEGQPGQGREWATTITVLNDTNYLGLRSFFSTRNIRHGSRNPPKYGNSIYVVVNMTASRTYTASNKTFLGGHQDYTPDGEWSHYTYQPVYYDDDSSSDDDEPGPTVKDKNEEIKISISLCFPSRDVVDVDVHLSSQNNRTEPTLAWHNSSRAYDTTGIRSHFELGSKNAETKRQLGYMDMVPRATGIWSSSTVYPLDYVTYDFLYGVGFKANPNKSYILCESCEIAIRFGEDRTGDFKLDSIHAANIALFQDTLRETSHPAAAIQALLTSAASSNYYDMLVRFNAPSMANYTLYKTLLAPGKRFLGFYVTMATLVADLLLTATISALFIASSRSSRLGNSWQAVFQTASLGADNSAVQNALLEMSAASTAKEVKGVLYAAGLTGKESVILADDDNTGTACLRLRAKTNG